MSSIVSGFTCSCKIHSIYLNICHIKYFQSKVYSLTIKWNENIFECWKCQTTCLVFMASRLDEIMISTFRHVFFIILGGYKDRPHTKSRQKCVFIICKKRGYTVPVVVKKGLQIYTVKYQTKYLLDEKKQDWILWPKSVWA